MVFPGDAITVYHELVGTGNFTLVSGNSPKTILGVSVQQSATNSTSDIRCGNTDIFVRNYGKDFPYNAINKICDGDIVVEKTGNDNASFIITYVPYHMPRYQMISIDNSASTISGQVISLLDTPTKEAMNGLSLVVFFGFGLTVLMLGISTAMQFMHKEI